MHQWAEIADVREEVEESKKHHDVINEQIADREKHYVVYAKKFDKVLSMGQSDAKELAVIRKNVKQLPTIFESEPSVKICKKDFNRLIDMAYASGTLEKLNEIYNCEMEHMQVKNDKLTNLVMTLKSKILQYDKFFGVKGLEEEFRKFARLKLIKERMQDKQKLVKNQKQNQAVNSVSGRKKNITI